MKSGFCKSKIISINPDIYWLEQELSIQEEPEYIWTDRDGVRNCKIDIYFEDNQNNVFKSEIYLKDKLKQGKSDNFCYVNQVGDNQWVTNENQLFDNFKNWVQVVSWGINGEKIEDEDGTDRAQLITVILNKLGYTNVEVNYDRETEKSL